MIRLFVVWLGSFLLLGAAIPATGQQAFRTDSNPDESLPWYQTKPGEFPPEGSAHYFSGELIGVDHVNRTGKLRVDRTDAQRRSHWDLSVEFRLLPFGSLQYHGASAALRDIPIGTHLHGWFFIKDEEEEVPTEFHNRQSIEAEFTKAFRLQDDFSHYAGRNHGWRIDKADLDAMKLAATQVVLDSGESVGAQQQFDLVDSTDIWEGRCLGRLEDLKPGQVVQMNLTWATLYGPGRCTDIWIDEESRQVATERQQAQHAQHQRERGLAGWIDEVDNQKRILKLTLFDGFDESLLEEVKPNGSVTVVVAEDSLRSYDQVNDRKGGKILAVEQVEAQPGSSGVQVTIEISLLLEGFRPHRIVRIFPSGWPVESIPLEERLWPARD